MLFVVIIGFGICTYAQDCKNNIRAEWRKDGQNGSGSSGGYPAYVNVTNDNNYDVVVTVEVLAVSMADGEKKTFKESFTIKAKSNKTTTPGKYAIVNTRWYRGVKEKESSIKISCSRL